MMVEKREILEKIAAIRSEIDGLSGGKRVYLLAATKTQDKETLDMVLRMPEVDFVGENRVQEFCDKFDGSYPEKWHFIGRLQTNKVKYLVGNVALIHSLDSLRLAEEIDKRSAAKGIVTPCLIEVNLGEELAKGGVALEQIHSFYEQLQSFPSIKVEGLMGVAPLGCAPQVLKAYYGGLAKAYESLQESADGIRFLSAGMSGDYAAAIEYAGANLVRIGSGIFGKRSL